jgi:lactoylglutathione lyase
MTRLTLLRSGACLLMMIAALLAMPAAQAQTPHMNHTTIYVVDLQKSADFYQNVLQLKKIPEPFHDGKHVWIQIGDHAQLHIVSGAKEDIPHDINIHLAFSVPSVEAFAKHLDEMHIKYGNWAQTTTTPQVRPDGVKHVYLQDPDGFWIEIDDDKF